MATNKGRSVDFTSAIYIGETIVPAFKAGSSIEIIDAKANRYKYESPYSDIDTSAWGEGMATVIITEDATRVQYFQVVDPISIASEFNKIKKILEEIDEVISARLAGGGQIQVTINNKSLMNESLSSLYAIRANYIRRANAELAKANGKNPDNPIKSVTQFKRGGY